MILDELNEFCDATAASTAGTGRALVGDVIDLSAGSKPNNAIEGVYFVLQVDTTFTSGGAATVQFELASDAQAAIATDGTATEHITTASFALAALTAGAVLFAGALPYGSPAYERYLGVLQNVGTAALTAGKINAFLTRDISQWVAIADATN